MDIMYNFIMAFIGLTILFVLVGLAIKYYFDLIQERVEFDYERNRHNKELGYKG